MRKTLSFVVVIGILIYGFFAVREYRALPAMAINETPLETPLIEDTPIPQPTSTPTIDSIATLQIMSNELATAQESERQKQLEIDALIRQNAEYTAQAEANQMAIAKMTQQVYETAVSGTQTAIPMTETAFPAVLAMQESQMTAEVEQRDFIRSGPTITKAAKDADLYVKFGDSITQSEIFMRYAVGALCITLILLAVIILIFSAVHRNSQAEETQVGEAPTPVTKPAMHFEPTEQPGVTRRINPNAPCTIDELTEFAEGLLRFNKTMAFGQWEGTSVHKHLKDLRQWMEFNRLSVLIPGYTNEYMPTHTGVKFLQFALDNGTTPSPYACMDEAGKEEVKPVLSQPTYTDGFISLNNGEEKE